MPRCIVASRDSFDFYAVEHAADVTGDSPDTIRRAADSRVLRSFRDSTGRRLFRRHDLERYALRRALRGVR